MSDMLPVVFGLDAGGKGTGSPDVICACSRWTGDRPSIVYATFHGPRAGGLAISN